MNIVKNMLSAIVMYSVFLAVRTGFLNIACTTSVLKGNVVAGSPVPSMTVTSSYISIEGHKDQRKRYVISLDKILIIKFNFIEKLVREIFGSRSGTKPPDLLCGPPSFLPSWYLWLFQLE